MKRPTSQPSRQNGGVRLGGSGRREQGVYRSPPQRRDEAVVTSSGSGLRGRGHSSIHPNHPLCQDVKPESPEEIPVRTVAATPRRKNAQHPAQGSKIIDVIELGDNDEVPVASHAPPVVSASAPPRAVPSLGQGMAHPYVQMDEATVNQFRGLLHQLFPPAPAPYVASQPGTVAVPQLPPPTPSTHVAVAPETVAIPEFHPNQMSYPTPPLGTVAIQLCSKLFVYPLIKKIKLYIQL
ncbi:hypothetical protein CAEBREN_10461 [Caenorhabditis brenneri]|uniref:Uncharacterized protein n=1 Tax=Caenorhabditis brenneri TaxID=135651 RepID=G0NX37_CAEBE|nr:hypothetical protein CAEBREN_10461 [Caenorhabditis brenneri]